MGISIVMPVYNVDLEYIKKSIISVYKQVYEDWELIIIDDGSNPKCAAYLDSFLSERVNVFHQENQGVSVARNNGVRFASKEWIFFLDPDDWMDKNELHLLYNTAIKNEADGVCCNAILVKETKNILGPKRSKNMIVFEKENLNALLLEVLAPGSIKKDYKIDLGNFMRTPWAKIYRKDLILDFNIKFPEDIHPNEDTIFNFMYWARCNKVIVLNDYCHYYRISFNGVTQKYRDTWTDNSIKTLQYYNAMILKFPGIKEYELQTRFFILLLICDVCRMQFFHSGCTLSCKSKKHQIKKFLYSQSEFRTAINDVFNPYYGYRRLVAICLKLHLYKALDFMYRR